MGPGLNLKMAKNLQRKRENGFLVFSYTIMSTYFDHDGLRNEEKSVIQIWNVILFEVNFLILQLNVLKHAYIEVE